jgi:hypothetical protein
VNGVQCKKEQVRLRGFKKASGIVKVRVFKCYTKNREIVFLGKGIHGRFLSERIMESDLYPWGLQDGAIENTREFVELYDCL